MKTLYSNFSYVNDTHFHMLVTVCSVHCFQVCSPTLLFFFNVSWCFGLRFLFHVYFSVFSWWLLSLISFQVLFYTLHPSLQHTRFTIITNTDLYIYILLRIHYKLFFFIFLCAYELIISGVEWLCSFFTPFIS